MRTRKETNASPHHIDARTRKQQRRTAFVSDVSDEDDDAVRTFASARCGANTSKFLDVRGAVLRVALERAFLLADVQSRLLTSGVTVARCVVVPNYNGNCRSTRRYDDDDAVMNDDDEKGNKAEEEEHRQRERRFEPTSISIHAANVGDARIVLSSNVASRRRHRLLRGDGVGGGGGGLTAAVVVSMVAEAGRDHPHQ
jgi:hypothetical protein